MLILNNTAGILIHNPIQYSFHSTVTCVLVLHLVEVSRAISVPKVGHQLLWLPYTQKVCTQKQHDTVSLNVCQGGIHRLTDNHQNHIRVELMNGSPLSEGQTSNLI